MKKEDSETSLDASMRDVFRVEKRRDDGCFGGRLDEAEAEFFLFLKESLGSLLV